MPVGCSGDFISNQPVMALDRRVCSSIRLVIDIGQCEAQSQAGQSFKFKVHIQ
jgi:hypothetical protein